MHVANMASRSFFMAGFFGVEFWLERTFGTDGNSTDHEAGAREKTHVTQSSQTGL
jgi:hypothetical protein